MIGGSQMQAGVLVGPESGSASFFYIRSRVKQGGQNYVAYEQCPQWNIAMDDDIIVVFLPL